MNAPLTRRLLLATDAPAIPSTESPHQTTPEEIGRLLRLVEQKLLAGVITRNEWEYEFNRIMESA